MKTKPILLITGLCAAGFISGFAGKRLTGGATAPVSPDKPVSRSEKRGAADGSVPEADTTSRPVKAKLSTLRSTDTLETIMALDDASLYSRLALWMMDASEKDIAAYWQHYRQKKDRANEINDLIFINWSRLDPQAAIAASAGTPDEHYAWWAWACHDPKAALSSVIANNPTRLNNVTWGIGEFHPDWLLEHFDEIPEDGRDMAFGGLTKWDDTDKPEEILDFLKEHGGEFDDGIFATLIRKDPWAAYDWIQKNEGTITSNYGSTEDAMELLVKSMGETQPDALERLANQTPSGEAKRKMEAVLFENLLKTDPETALEQAESTKAPRIAAERLAAVGLSLAQSDPAKALELTQKLFTIYPDALDGTTWVRYPNGSSGSGSEMKEVEQLVDELMDKDPAKILEMIPPDPAGTMSDEKAFPKLADRWADRDLVGYTNWVNQLTDPAIRNEAAAVVVDKLTEQKRFLEAAEWATNSGKKGNLSMINIFYQWNRTNPAEADVWLDSTDLPDSDKKDYRDLLKSIKSRDEP